MHHDHLDMETVTLELDEERLEAVDDLAFKRHRGNREAAIRELLDRWLKESENEREDEVTNASSARTEERTRRARDGGGTHLSARYPSRSSAATAPHRGQ